MDYIDEGYETPWSPDESEDLKLFRLGQELMENGDYEPAISFFQRSVEISPHYKTLQLMGDCLVRLKRFKEAIVPLAGATGLTGKRTLGCCWPKLFVSWKSFCGRTHNTRSCCDYAAPSQGRCLVEVHSTGTTKGNTRMKHFY